MSAGREGFDLFNKYGRASFFRKLKKGVFESFMWRDTFGRFVCMLIGHKPKDVGDGDIACFQCQRFLPRKKS